MPATGPEVQKLEGISKVNLPAKGSLLFGGNFIVLDIHLASSGSESWEKVPEKDSSEISYVDVGFGDDRKKFAGMHRFEIQHHFAKEEKDEKEEKGEEEVRIWYSSLSCNPSIDRPLFWDWAFALHRWYAMCLFRDGIECVIRG